MIFVMCAHVGVSKTINAQILFQVIHKTKQKTLHYVSKACFCLLTFDGHKVGKGFTFMWKYCANILGQNYYLYRKCNANAFLPLFCGLLAIYWKTICNNSTDYMHVMWGMCERDGIDVWALCTALPQHITLVMIVCDYMLCLHNFLAFIS